MASEPNSWLKTTVGDFIEEQGGEIKTGPFGTKLRASEYTETGVPVISVGEVGFGELRLHDRTPRVDHTVTSRMPEYLLEEGDIVFGRKGAVERSALVRPEQAGWFLGSDGIRLRLPTNCDRKFIAYQFLSRAHINWMMQHALGTTMPSLNQKIIARIPVVVPPLSKQKEIASILGALDDKIALNRRMNETLESMARAIFKSWFVDFDPVRAKMDGRQPTGMYADTASLFPDSLENQHGGLMPTGWRTRALYDTAKFINGAAFRSEHFCDRSNGLPVVKIAELKNGVTAQTKFSNRADLDPKYKIDTGTLLYSWSGSPETSLDTFLWTLGPGLLNQHIFKIETDSEPQKHLVYYLLKYLRPTLIEIARNKQTTGLGHVTVADMRRLEVCFPPDDVLVAFDQQVGPIFNACFLHRLECKTLATLRDTLLPKLLSGELRVGDAMKQVDDVMSSPAGEPAGAEA